MATSAKHSHKVAWGIAIVLLILVVVVGFKCFMMKQHWDTYTGQTQKMVMMYPTLDSQEDAALLATTITTLPSTNSPVFHQLSSLRSYVSTISRQMNRDIVIVDTKKMILADTIASNEGSTYSGDKGSEVGLTLKDGMPRAFTETSDDYPKGIDEAVVPVKNSQSQIIGAVILSKSSIFSK